MAFEAGVSVAAQYGPKTTAGTIAARINANIGGAGLENWVYVENIPAGAGAGQTGNASNAAEVFKCKGSGTSANSAGVDFFVIIYYVVATGACAGIRVAESYLDIAGNPANADRGKIKRWCPLPQAGAPTAAPDYWFTDTYTTIQLSNAPDFSPTSNTTGWSYWLKIDHNFMFLSVRSGPTTSYFMAGLFDSVISNTTDTMPLACLTTGNGSFSRLPGVTLGAGGTAQWGAAVFPWTTTILLNSTLVTTDLWLNSRIPVSRAGLAHSVSAANTTTYGGVRGLLKSEILVLYTSAATFLPGDTIVIDGNTWTCITGGATFTGSISVANGLSAVQALTAFVRAN